MIAHNFSTPIQPGVLRISAIWRDELHTAELPSAKLQAAVRAFADFAGLVLSASRGDEVEHACTDAATAAAAVGDEYVVAMAALWQFLHQPEGQGEMNADRMCKALADNGAAMLTASVDATGTEWRFQLFDMPRWPAAVAPFQASKRSRRRWR